VVWQPAAAKGADVFAGSWHFGKLIDAQRVPPPTASYDSPVPLGLAEVSSPIRSEAASRYALPPGVTAARLLHHTPTSTGEYCVASGVLSLQYGTPLAAQRPLIAGSHGTSELREAAVFSSQMVMTHSLLRMRARKLQHVCAQREYEQSAASMQELDAIPWSVARLANKPNEMAGRFSGASVRSHCN
jgi:hypothetical protein